ncbi:PRC-barrel domain-containing protein [Salinarimonas ramus]|uniref:Photosystem reaction center subunit H n=1 Tax=Salinarimonas ramus TaxID=690164 RepID=A0A917QBQ7_9HYPH|nr:PRC-barrel domain-containing protein [Salinarimonas ramus]GGK43012.1 photosystem reaction center subunit H [Salinarimonas ramus]
MTMFRTTLGSALALAAATALSTAPVHAQMVTETAPMTTPMTETAPMETTGALGGISTVFATADDLDDVEVYGINGEEIGEVEEIVVGADGTHYIVLEVGGFLGIGDDDVAIPMDRFAARGEESLVLVSMTEDELEAMAEYEEGDAGYTVLDGMSPIEMRMME